MTDEASAKGTKLCPICKRPMQPRYKPFCSARCADVDLNRWLSESYRIPQRPELEEESGPAPAEDEGEHG